MRTLGGGPLLLLATFVFSVMQVCVRLLEDLPVVQVVFFRSFVAIIICWILLHKKKIPKWGNDKLPLILRGLTGSAALFLYFYSIHELPFATAVSVHYLTPLFTVLIAGLALKEASTKSQWFCLFAAFVGVLLVQGPAGGLSARGLVAGLLAAVVSGFSYNLIRSLREAEHPLVIVFYFPLVTIPLLAPWTYLQWQWPAGFQWLLLIAIGLLTQLAQMLLTRAFSVAPASEISVFQYVGVVFGLIYSSVIFNEPLTAVMLLGGALIIISGVLSFQYTKKLTNEPSRG